MNIHADASGIKLKEKKEKKIPKEDKYNRL